MLNQSMVEYKYYTASAWWKQIRDFQLLSRCCITARVMTLQREISGELSVVEWIRELHKFPFLLPKACTYLLPSRLTGRTVTWN